MPVDVERIIQYIKQGDQDNVQIYLDDYNTEVNTMPNKMQMYIDVLHMSSMFSELITVQCIKMELESTTSTTPRYKQFP